MASLNFTDIAEVGSKDRDDGSFLVQVSGVGVAANAVVYSGILNEDVDRGPQLLRPFPLRCGDRQAGNMPRTWSVAALFNELPKGQLAHPWMWRRCREHDPSKGCGHPGFLLTVLTRSPGLAGRFSEAAPLGQSGTSRRNSPCCAPTTTGSTFPRPQLTAQHTSPGNRSGALVGRDNRPVRGSHATAECVSAWAWATSGWRSAGTTAPTARSSSPTPATGNKVGEMSTMLFRALFPGNNQEEHLVSFIVFRDPVSTRLRTTRGRP